MTENDAVIMPVDMTEPNSGYQFDTSFFSSSELIALNNRDRILSGYPGASVVQGDSISSQAWIQDPNYGRVSDSYMLRNMLPEREPMGFVPYGASNQISSTQVQDRYMEGVPLAAASIATLLASRLGNQESLERPISSAPLPYPTEIPRSIVPNDNDGNRNLYQSSMRYGHDDVPAVGSTKWDFNNAVAHPELAATAMGRTGLQPFEAMMNVYPNEWMTSGNANLDTDSPSGCSRLSNELSLSLAMSNPSIIHRTSIQDQCSEICSSSSAYERCLGSEQTSCSRNLSLSFGSFRPVQLSQFLTGSRYIHAMQELLAEIATYSLGSLDLMKSSAIGMEDRTDASISSCIAIEGYPSAASEDLSDVTNMVRYQIDPSQGRDAERKKKQLLGLLQVVDGRYSECVDEIHTVISAFHAVTELDPPIHARFALQTISFLYKNLRERISNHILAIGTHFSQGAVGESDKSFEASFIQKQWALQQLKKKDNQLWRPQRGLPERSVSVLRAWMFQNFLHPYPKDSEKHLLAVKSGLTRSQVSNWFINARVRLWKPMIEEMYSEMHRRKVRQNEEETNNNQRNRVSLENARFTMY